MIKPVDFRAAAKTSLKSRTWMMQAMLEGEKPLLVKPFAEASYHFISLFHPVLHFLQICWHLAKAFYGCLLLIKHANQERAARKVAEAIKMELITALLSVGLLVISACAFFSRSAATIMNGGYLPIGSNAAAELAQGTQSFTTALFGEEFGEEAGKVAGKAALGLFSMGSKFAGTKDDLIHQHTCTFY